MADPEDDEPKTPSDAERSAPASDRQPPHAGRSDASMQRAALRRNRRRASAPGPRGRTALPRPSVLVDRNKRSTSTS